MGETMESYFNPEQIAVAKKSFAEAETITGRFFGIDARERKHHRYDVITRAFLEKHEITGDTFAHLFKYEFSRTPGGEKNQGEAIPFYRICLQDDVILDAVKRADNFVRLDPLLLYVAAHELVHVIRFERGEGDFYATGDEKRIEEEKVHRLTRNLLKPFADTGMNLVLECFSDQYRMYPYV